MSKKPVTVSFPFSIFCDIHEYLLYYECCTVIAITGEKQASIERTGSSDIYEYLTRADNEQRL